MQSAAGKAKTWVRRTARAGGIGPVSRAFAPDGGNANSARVDIEVIRGQPNIVE